MKKFIAKDQKRRGLVQEYEMLRKVLLTVTHSPLFSNQQKLQARFTLHSLPPDSSKVRVRNRCISTGRPRGIYRKWKLSRIRIRDLIGQRMIPGLRKASW